MTSAKLIRHLKKLLWVSSQHKLISKYTKFHYHYAYNSKTTGRAFFTLFIQIKYATPDNPNNLGLKFNPKKTTSASRTKADL